MSLLDTEDPALATTLIWSFSTGGDGHRSEAGGEGLEEQVQVGFGGQGAHDADAEDLAGQLAHAAGDIDAELIEQALADLGVVDAFGDADGVERGQTVAGGGVHPQAQGFDAADEGVVGGQVPCEAVLDAFVEDGSEALLERVEHGDGRGVVVALGNQEVLEQALQVQVPDGVVDLAGFQPLGRARRDGEGGESGRAAQALLRATEGDVNVVGVDIDGDGAEGGDAIGDGERADLAGRTGDGAGGLEGSGGGFGVDEGGDGGTLAFEEGSGFVLGEDFAPGFVEADDLHAVAAAHFADALAEEAVDENSEFRAGIAEVGNGGFHAGAAGTGDGQGELVFGTEEGAESGADFLENLEEIGVHVADDRPGHGLVNTWLDLGRAGSEEQSLRGIS